MESASLAEYRRHFEADVFVSYAHKDDDRIGREQKGWIAQFHEDLSSQIRVYLGADARVWRDSEIRNNDDFEKKIVRRLARTALFMPVVSASFLNSEWCIREVKEFASSAEEEFGMHLDGEKKRIFKVERIPVDRNALPDELQGTTTYQFFIDGKRVLRPYISDRDGETYYAQLVDLAIDVADAMNRLAVLARSGGVAVGAADAGAPRRTVYLAETTYALEDAASELRRDFKDRGYLVLPETDLPRRAGDYCEKVAEMLERCDVSVHLVGADYGFIPEHESKKSNVWIQHELALARSESGHLKQIVWLTETEKAEERQKAFIDYLRVDPVATAKAETLEGGLEELKTEIQDTFARIEKTRAAAAAPSSAPVAARRVAEAAEGEPPRVYILCERADRQTPEFVALRKYLASQGVETTLPTIGEGETLELHREKLAECDGALIYFGAGAPRWFEVKLNDFRKFLHNRTPPVCVKAVYIAEPSTLEKEEVETVEALVLRPVAGSAPEAVAPFIARLKKRA
jgi:TIR domain